MINRLKAHGRFEETLFMAILSLCCFGFSLFRYVYSDTKLFLFLNWNLFLAFVPWALTSLAVMHKLFQRHTLTLSVLLGSWVLFFPNAPYILTDLFHLRERTSMPIWFDLVLILFFAWTGLLFGFLSLWDIERIMGKSVHQNWIKALSASLLFMGSFGIYVGRYLRWNSWDIITEPFRLCYSIGDKVINPIHHPRAWGMTLFFGLFLNMIYWSFRMVRKRA